MPNLNDATPAPYQILLVDDDIDDCFFFKHSLKELPFLTQLTTIDGEQLMSYLYKNLHQLPDLLFLDLNMPSKNGFECLSDIKSNKKLQHLPIIIYSTSFHEQVADELYKNGAHYYIRKADLTELKEVLHRVLTMMAEKKFDRPLRNKFVLSFAEA